jgi:hypothetical protein
MIVKTPKQKGKGKHLSKGKGESPQSDTSGDTASTVDNSTSIFSSGFGQTGTGSTGVTLTLEEQQEGLPEEIKSKTYPSSDLITAEDELLNDLEKYFLFPYRPLSVCDCEASCVPR